MEQNNLKPQRTASGTTECSRMPPPVPGIGTAGTELPPSSSVPSVCSTTTCSTHAIGLTMYLTARSIVSVPLKSRDKCVSNSVTILSSYSVAICKDTPNGAIYIEKSCVRYWLCVGGYPRLQRCPAGLAFQPNTGRCELAQSVVGCEPPPTTPSPGDEDDEEQPANALSGPPPGSNPQAQRGPQAPQGPAPQPFRPSQPGVRLVGR